MVRCLALKRTLLGTGHCCKFEKDSTKNRDPLFFASGNIRRGVEVEKTMPDRCKAAADALVSLLPNRLAYAFTHRNRGWTSKREKRGHGSRRRHFGKKRQLVRSNFLRSHSSFLLGVFSYAAVFSVPAADVRSLSDNSYLPSPGCSL